MTHRYRVVNEVEVTDPALLKHYVSGFDPGAGDELRRVHTVTDPTLHHLVHPAVTGLRVVETAVEDLGDNPPLGRTEWVDLRTAVTVVARVSRDGVRQLTIVAGDTTMLDERCPTVTEDQAFEVKQWADSHTWAVLHDLPDSVRWEG